MPQMKLSRLKQLFTPSVKATTDHNLVDLRKYILPVTLDNTDRASRTGDEAFNTTDYIYLESLSEVKTLAPELRTLTPTAYAINHGTRVGKYGTAAYWLRSAYSQHGVDYVNCDGVPYDRYVSDAGMGIVPAMHLDLKAAEILGCVNREKQTIEFGWYPKTLVGNLDELDKLWKHRQLVATGKSYIGGMKANGGLIANLEYELHGERYVNVKKSGENHRNLWYKVKPIVWKIKNWDAVENGTADYLDVRADEIIMGGIPFYPKLFDDNNAYWQNSSLRGFLNGINVNQITSNGNVKYQATHGGNFTDRGFLQTAFVATYELLETEEKDEKIDLSKNL